jgi:hypothetical protein
MNVCAKLLDEAADYIQPALSGSHVQGRISIRFKCLIDVGAKVRNQAPYHVEVPVVNCNTQRIPAIVARLVDVDTKLLDQANYQCKKAVLSSDNQRLSTYNAHTLALKSLKLDHVAQPARLDKVRLRHCLRLRAPGVARSATCLALFLAHLSK